MGKRALLLLFCLLFVVPLVSCQNQAVCPQLDIGEGLYETERVAKITNLVEGERAYFTLDGSEPGMDSTPYREDAGISLLEGENQVKVVKYSAKDKPGPVLTAIYTIMPQLPLLATPDGVYNGVFNARITNLKEGFKAYYTLDGSEPDTASPVYTAAGIPLTEGENRVKVVKYDGAGNHSAVLTA
ncbi:MAG: FN3 associated domain-containing protein, partial [Eubacteriales bacterium]|nr:FN3 associated domain-containing protein [Eubacteriales bacterium]